MAMHPCLAAIMAISGNRWSVSAWTIVQIVSVPPPSTYDIVADAETDLAERSGKGGQGVSGGQRVGFLRLSEIALDE